MSNDRLDSEGILCDGYGIVPKLVMRDKNLTPEAKAIYSYMCSFAGAGKTAFPSVELMCGELCMTRERFYKHRKLLVAYGYITIFQEKDKGKMKRNIYTLAHFPKKVEELLQQIQNIEPQSDFPTAENPTTDKPQSENPTAEIPTSENPTGNINSLNINNLNNNNLNNKKEKEPTLPEVDPSKGNSNSVNGIIPQKQNKDKGIVLQKRKYGEFNNVLLTDDELKKLMDRFEDWQEKIDDLSFYLDSKGAKYKSHYSTILSWDRRDKKNAKPAKTDPSNSVNYKKLGTWI